MGSFKSLVFALIFGANLLHDVRGEGELDNFVRLIMSNYTQWLQNENLDPSPSLNYTWDLTGNTSFVAINCELSNQYSIGHSEEIHIDNIITDLPNRRIRAELYYSHNVTMKGTYEANGTVNGHLLNGSGNWFISSSDIVLGVDYDGFTLTPEGYIDLSTATTGCYNDIIIESSHFDGLLDDGAGGYADRVKRTIEMFYNVKAFNYCEQHPLVHLIKTYFKAVFDSTPISEMGTAPPTTIFTTTSTTSTTEATPPSITITTHTALPTTTTATTTTTTSRNPTDCPKQYGRTVSTKYCTEVTTTTMTPLPHISEDPQ